MMQSAPAEIRRSLSQRLAYHGPALGYFTAMTCLLVFPVLAALFGDRIPGWEGDNLYYVRSMWWWKRALVDLGVSPFLDITAYYPIGHHIAYSEMTPTNTLLWLPLTAAFGPEFSYNFAILFSFVATGVGTYLWVHYLTGSRPAGVLAGTIVAFLPFRFAHMPGHLPQMTMQWIPLALYAFERFRDRRALADAAWLGVWVAFTIISCWYYGYALAVIFPLYVIVRTAGDWALWRQRRWWTGIGAAVLLAAAIMAPFIYQMVILWSAGRLDRSILEMQSWALNWYDMFVPNVVHPLWGETVSGWFPELRALWVEKVHTLSVAALAAAVAGVIYFRHTKRRVILALVAMWLVSYLIALGPFLKSGDELVRVHVPDAVAGLAARMVGSDSPETDSRQSFINDGVPVPLPSAFMFKFVPFTSSMRAMSRFSIWTALATAALAGFGLVALMGVAERRWGPPARGAVAVALLAFVAFESLSHIPTMPVGPRMVDLWLADQPNETVIVELPVAQGTRALQNYYATHNERRNFFGWSGDSFAPPVLLERQAALQSFPSPESIEFLRQSDVSLVLFSPSQIPDWATMEPVVKANPAFEFVQTFSGVDVYRVRR